MRIIGITGGVGAGKSEILKYLKEVHQAVVVEADKVAHVLMSPGEVCHEKIVGFFGKEILKEDQTIDRQMLGAIVFDNPDKLEQLNKITHPEVKKWIKNEIEKECSKGTTNLFIVEAALLIEDHYEEICDELWYIHTDAKIRRKRLKESRGYDDEKIDGIMENQLSPEKFQEACQVMIENSGAFEDTKKQIDKQLG